MPPHLLIGENMYQCLAAIDIGSNTVHLAVAGIDGHHISILADQSIFVRLADGILTIGNIPEERILTTTQAILHLRNIARGYGAEQIIVVATEVARKAQNIPALMDAITATTGLKPLILSGLDEAMLTFRGATHARHLPSEVAVADLGGGSLEVIIVELGHSSWRTSLPVGSAFMHDRFTPDDPPAPSEIEAVQEYLHETLQTIPHIVRIQEMLITGGTVNALMRLIQQAQGRAIGDRHLRREDLDHALRIMLQEPAALIAERFRLRIERARLLPVGTAILGALLDYLNLPGIIVSPAGIREGIISAASIYGEDWLAGARENAYQHVYRKPASLLSRLSTEEKRIELTSLAFQPATQVAWDLIHRQTLKMLAHRKAAREGNSKAIHDMRIDSRRLRTTIDIFAPCFASRPLRQFRDAVKNMAKLLGNVRDHDVAIAVLQQEINSTDISLHVLMQEFIAQHDQERTSAQISLQKRLSRKMARKTLEYLEALRLAPEAIIPVTTIRAKQTINDLPLIETDCLTKTTAEGEPL